MGKKLKMSVRQGPDGRGVHLDDVINVGRRIETKGVAHKVINNLKPSGHDGYATGTEIESELGIRKQK